MLLFVAAARLAVAAGDGGEVVVADLDRHGARVELALGAATAPCRAPCCRSPRGSRRGPSGRARTCSRCPTTSARARRRPAGRRCRCASCCSQSASEPTVSRSTAGSAARTSTSLSMPRARSLRAVTGPTPHSASTGSPCRKCSTRSGAITVRPSGFCQPEAIFARNLFGRHAGRRGQPGRRADLGLEPPRDVHPQRLAPGVLGDVEIGLVERQRLDERRDAADRSRTPAARRRGTS